MFPTGILSNRTGETLKITGKIKNFTGSLCPNSCVPSERTLQKAYWGETFQMLSVYRFVLKSKQPETASEQACNGKDKCLLNLRIFSFIERLSFSNKETAVFLRCLQGIVICLQSKSTSEPTLLNIFLCPLIVRYSRICSFACYRIHPIQSENLF
jgi:hypothetical protein